MVIRIDKIRLWRGPDWPRAIYELTLTMSGTVCDYSCCTPWDCSLRTVLAVRSICYCRWNYSKLFLFWVNEKKSRISFWKLSEWNELIVTNGTYGLSLKNRLSWLISNGSVAFISLYGCGVRSHKIEVKPINATTTCSTIIKMTASRKPIESYKRPLTDGPTNAPKANVDVHNPDTSPYVSMLSGKPCRLKNVNQN